MGLILVVFFFFILISRIIQDSMAWIANQIVCLVHPKTAEETKREQQLKGLRKEKSSISMTDEFARYAKTERKINKLVEDIKAHNKTRSDAAFKYKLAIKGIFQVVQICVFLSLVWRWRSDPLIEMPQEWVWPFILLHCIPFISTRYVTGRGGRHPKRH